MKRRIVFLTLTAAFIWTACQKAEPASAARKQPATPQAGVKPAPKPVPAAAPKAAATPAAKEENVAAATDPKTQAKLDAARTVLKANRPTKNGTLSKESAVQGALDDLSGMKQAARPALDELLAFVDACRVADQNTPSDDWDLTVMPFDRPCQSAIRITANLAPADPGAVKAITAIEKANRHFSSMARDALKSMEKAATDRADAAAE